MFDRSKFEAAWVAIKQELLDHFNGEGMPKDAAEWYERVSPSRFLFTCSTHSPDRA